MAAFSFFAARGRVYAGNPDGKVIDLGTLAREDGGWAWRLDGNGLAGGGLPDEQAALRDIAARAGFLYLDGQFTAVADAREDGAGPPADAVRVDLDVDELQPGERMEDART